ncbi:MAG TPA: hypothetical protein VFW94_04210 [Candidatus Acidoferrales bacterium]|nr:hypothetical protein [Candidatus Acidoferrales bacterium]
MIQLRASFLLLCLAALADFFACGPLLAQQYDPQLFSGMKWRSIGPGTGGRIEAVAGVPDQPDTYYIGAVDGGVWKTTNAGLTWTPLFNHEAVASIGAIAIAPSDDNVIYVGTGEEAPRGDISFGDGVYKSTDGGKSWTNVGLKDTRQIARIIVDPRNPDVVYVAAEGHIYGANSERGVFRSTDGGKTWQKILYKDEQTGAIDLAMDPGNPRILYAALWQVRREPWHLSDGGPGSGLYKSVDGGSTWQQLSGHGLPTGVLGRVGVAVAGGSNGQRVYALIEAKDGGLFRSEDGGTTWHLVNDKQILTTRAWYFTNVFADPHSPNVVYVANNGFYRSIDGGHSFATLAIPGFDGYPGGADNHAFWVNPLHPQHMIQSHDQGIAISVDGGKTWGSRDNLPIGQFYHIAADNEFPYYVYGSQQDEGALGVVSNDRGGVQQQSYFMGGDDSECGFVLIDPANPDFLIAGGYGGALTIYDKKTGQLHDIAPWSNNNGGHAAAELKYRFNWTAPVALSPQNTHVIYIGSQYLLETDNDGANWHAISPDLTRNDKSRQQSSGGPIWQDNSSIEYYDTIWAIAPSPMQAGEIWAGTDDGLVQLTRDGGKTWRNVTPPQSPKWGRVSMIAASDASAGTAWVVVDNHENDDYQPWIFRTHDFGATWSRVNGGIAAPAYVHAIRQDPKDPKLLFAGTETGVYVSFDSGDHWQSLQLNLPTTSMRDFVIHGDDLIVATHGRAIWVLHDIAPLRQMAQAAAADVYLFRPSTAVRSRLGDPTGGALSYFLKTKPNGPVSLSVTDQTGRTGILFSSTGKNKLDVEPGMHRVNWNLRYPVPDDIHGGAAYDERSPRGIMALPGQYTVKLTVEGHTYTQPLTVVNDPRSKTSAIALAAEYKLATTLMDAMARDHQAVNQILQVRAQLKQLRQRLADDAGAKQILSAIDSLDQKADSIENVLYQPNAKTNEELLNFPTELNSNIAYLEDEVDFGDGTPTEQFQQMAREYLRELQQQIGKWHELQKNDLAALNRQIEQKQIPVIYPPPAPITSGSHKSGAEQ